MIVMRLDEGGSMTASVDAGSIKEALEVVDRDLIDLERVKELSITRVENVIRVPEGTGKGTTPP